MKKSLFITSMLLLFTWISAQEMQRFGDPRIISPEISGNKNVTFRLYSKEAHSVMVQGSWENERLEMKKDENGVWSAQTKPLIIFNF